MLIIHMGYPKTATTTLQNKYFNILDNNYNFLGRNHENKNSETFVKFILNYPITPKIEFLDKNRINIISEEALSLGCSLDGNFTRDKYLIRDNLLKLQSMIDMKIKLIFTIRNQADLLESLYMEMYGSCFKYMNDLDTPSKFVNNMEKYKSFFEWYNFFEIISFFKEKFEVEVFLFENLEDDRFEEIFNKDIKLALNYKLNVKSEKKINSNFSLDILLIKVLKKIYLLDFIYNLKKNYIFFDKTFLNLKKILSKIKLKSNNKLFFTKLQKQQILDFYKKDNKKLVKFFDEKLLKRYL